MEKYVHHLVAMNWDIQEEIAKLLQWHNNQGGRRRKGIEGGLSDGANALWTDGANADFKVRKKISSVPEGKPESARL